MRKCTVLLSLVLLHLQHSFAQEFFTQRSHSSVKVERVKASAKVGPTLLGLYQEKYSQEKGTQSTQLLKNTSFSDKLISSSIKENEYVLIKAIGKAGTSQLKAELEAIGLQQTSVFGEEISGYIPLRSVNKLASLGSLSYIRTSLRTTNAGLTGNQADIALKTDIARSTYGVDGSGIKIGVLSDSYNTLREAEIAISSGDLPGPGNPNGYLSPVTVLKEYSGIGSDEGRAMLELIHDLAPASELYFYTAFEGEADFANGILALAAAGCQVIVDDVSYLAEPFFQDGIIAQAVDAIHAQGISYFSSAGNYGDNSYQAAFNPSGEELFIDSLSVGMMHDFDDRPDSVNTRQSITIPANTSVLFGFQWVDNYSSLNAGLGAQTDLDIYFAMENTIVYSIDWQDILQDPVNVFSLSTGDEAVDLDVIITNYEGDDPSMLKYIIFNTAPTINTFDTQSSTSFGHANASGANGVGAVFYGYTPAYGVNSPILESFSSKGGTPIYLDQQGNFLTQPLIREKPDYCATDGSNTSFFGNDIGFDADIHPNFFGTSAAAPHAAAVAALMIEASGYTLSPEEVRATLISSAIDMEASAFDHESGYGLIQADVAVAASLQACKGVVINEAPQDQLFCSGGEARFRVEASGSSGSSTFTYRWQKSTDGGLSFENIGNDSSLLSLTNLTSSNDGERYRVILTDDNGTTFSEDDCTDTTATAILSLSGELPSIICIDNIIQEADSDQCAAVVTYSVGTTVSCGIASFEQVLGLPSGASFPVGTTQNTWVLIDSLGNQQNCSFMVTVLDGTPPVFSKVDSVIVPNDPGLCSASVLFDVPEATDNCGIDAVLQIGGKARGANFPVGVTENLFIGIDSYGNLDTAIQVIMVVDKEAPQAVVRDTTLYLDPIGMAGLDPVIHLLKEVVDNCGIDTVLVEGRSSFSCEHIGENNIDFTIRDLQGNELFLSSKVIVIADTPLIQLQTPPSLVCSEGEVRLTALVEGNFVSTFWQQEQNGNWSTLAGETDWVLTLDGEMQVGFQQVRFGVITVCDTLFSEPVAWEVVDCEYPEISGFSLIDADSQALWGPLEDGAIVRLENLPSQYNIIAEVEGEQVEKVFMELRGAEQFRNMERKAPYAIFGDQGGLVEGRSLEVGAYEILATAFFRVRDTLLAGGHRRIHFEIGSCAEDGPIMSAGPDLILSCDSARMAVLDGEAVGVGISYTWSGPDGFSSKLLATEVNQEGEYILSVLDSLGCQQKDSLRVLPCPDDCEAEVVSFNLVDASTNAVIQVLEDGTVLDLSLLGDQLNIEANIRCGVNIKSVVMELGGSQVRKRTENRFPYTMAGDSSGIYFAHKFISGEYSLKATPYAKRNGRGEAGESIGISFTVVNAPGFQGFTLDLLQENEVEWRIYPNPAKGFLLVDLDKTRQGNYLIRLLDMKGSMLNELIVEASAQHAHTYVINLQDITSGIYLLEIQVDGYIRREKVSIRK
ncbi:MAG: HYR domain-containing protein [Bacteroidota bacterium]